MQVERHSGERVSNASLIYPELGDSGGKLPVIPDSPQFPHGDWCKDLSAKDEAMWYQLVGRVKAYQGFDA